jgi:uridine kinase
LAQPTTAHGLGEGGPDTALGIKPYVVGLAGGSASGKSLLLSFLQQTIGSVICVVGLDDFYLPLHLQPKDDQGQFNFDEPQGIDRKKLVDCVTTLIEGKGVAIEEYAYNHPERREKTTKWLPAKPIILVEGLFVLFYEEMWPLLDLKVFIHADEALRYKRRLERDTKVRGIAPEMVDYQWRNHVNPSYEKYLAPCMSQADLVVNNNQGFDKALRILQQHLHSEAAWRTNSRS